MGKGSRPRPFEVDHKQFSNNWDKIFGKKDFKEEKTDKSIDPKKDESKKTK